MKKVKSAMSKLIVCIMIISMLAGCQSTDSTKAKTSTQPAVSTAAATTTVSQTVSVDDRVKELLGKMTVDEKVGQLMQAGRDNLNPADVKKYYLGSVLSGGGSHPGQGTKDEWLNMMNGYQDAAKSTRLGIPIIYGIDAVHGHNTINGAVVFPHNIGLGAANDPELMTEIGNVTAQELLTSGINWNFAPCIAVSRDERWGRSYESYSETPDIVSSLSVPYIKAMQENYKVAACSKHFLADGGTIAGSANTKYFVDQGNAKISEDELRNIHLAAYKKDIEAGVKTIMVSFSSWNGLKMHENKTLVQDVLKGELGFKGFVVSDYEAIHQLKGSNIAEQLISSFNAGVDMFMEPQHWKQCIEILKKAVNDGKVTNERLDDAVSRILKVKFEMGLFENPIGDQSLAAKNFGEDKNRQVAQKAVQESLVLLKNNKNVLPLKKNAKIFVTGPAANNVGIQCGGWTRSWQGSADKGGKWMQGTTILEGFQKIAKENGGTIITDPKQAKNADVAVVVIGEKPYAEYEGDDKSLDLYKGMALPDNKKAIEEAKATGLPVVTILVSGRPRIVTDEINSWDAFVAAWLPGTEGAAVADVLYGDKDFKGKLSFTWPKSLDQIPINVDNMGGKEPLFPYGFGLKMKN